MAEFTDFIEALRAGGDVAMYVIAYLLWRIDRRVLALEMLYQKECRK